MKINKKSNLQTWEIILIAVVYLAFTVFGVWMCNESIKGLRKNADLSYDTLTLGEYHLDSYQKKKSGSYTRIWYVLHFAENSQEFIVDGDIVNRQLFEETLANVSQSSTVITVYYIQSDDSQICHEICEITIGSVTYLSLDDYVKHQRFTNIMCISGGIAVVVGGTWFSYGMLKFFQKGIRIA